MNRIVPLILAVALFMEQMDSTVIATALPAIAADLNVGPITLKLALTSYMVALAVFIPVSGWMADRFGAKKIFRLAISVFVIQPVEKKISEVQEHKEGECMNDLNICQYGCCPFHHWLKYIVHSNVSALQLELDINRDPRVFHIR
jgi:hypothetical protein